MPTKGKEIERQDIDQVKIFAIFMFNKRPISQHIKENSKTIIKQRQL